MWFSNKVLTLLLKFKREKKTLVLLTLFCLCYKIIHLLVFGFRNSVGKSKIICTFELAFPKLSMKYLREAILRYKTTKIMEYLRPLTKYIITHRNREVTTSSLVIWSKIYFQYYK